MEYLFIISGTIGSWWSSVSADYVRYLLSKHKGEEVHVGFCSPGGTVDEGLQMYQAFKDHGNVCAHAFGMNASISTIAMLGCKSIDIVKGSFFLIHNSWSLVDKYEQANKETLDRMIEALKLQRENLATIDDVMAQLYADKCGKSLDEVKAQMKKGTWLSAEQAVEFGLVDSIRSDAKAEAAAASIADDFTRSYHNSTIIKDAGIPPLPAGDIAAVADEQGNPTPNFIQKTWNALQNLLSNQQATDKKQNSMIKIFNSVMALLALADGFKPMDDGNIALSQEQMKKIDDQLSAHSQALADKEAERQTLADEVETLKAEKQKLENDIKTKDAQIKALSGSASADEKSDEQPVEGAASFSMSDVFNSVKF